MVFDLIVFALTAFKTMEAVREPKMALSRVLLRDGALSLYGEEIVYSSRSSLPIFRVRQDQVAPLLLRPEAHLIQVHGLIERRERCYLLCKRQIISILTTLIIFPRLLR